MTGGLGSLERDERGDRSERPAGPSLAGRGGDAEPGARTLVGTRSAPTEVDERRGLVPDSRPADAEYDHDSLRAYLLDGLGRSRPRPRDGREVRVTLEPGDVERARDVLRAFARRPGTYDPLALAATSLDVSLQDLARFVGEYAEPVTVSVDRWDCALVQFAAAETAGRDPAGGDLALDPPGKRGSDRLDLHCPQ